MPIHPMTPRQVTNAVARTLKLSPADAVISHVNARLADPKCSPINGMYQFVHIPVSLTVEQMLEVHARLLAASWKSVQVVVWQGTAAVSLHARATFDWECAYNGKKVSELSNAKKRTRKAA